jgi:hypothetical protein
VKHDLKIAFVQMGLPLFTPQHPLINHTGTTCKGVPLRQSIFDQFDKEFLIKIVSI